MESNAGIGARNRMKPLFIFEMANNHQGSVEHGKRIIHELKSVCEEYKNEFEFAVKFQFRNLDTFIHPEYIDCDTNKNVKRFKDTRLSQEQFQELYEEVRKCNFRAICTPFDEVSVDHIVQMGFDYIKIASCSAGDWPLLEKVAATGMPVILSAAGSSLSDIKRVAGFFDNRKIDLTLMHCVAEYPTTKEHLQLNQIDLYKHEFAGHRIGFSTHESPENTLPVMLAVAKGAEVFEKHVGVSADNVTLNAYSANPMQVQEWLEAAKNAFSICGTKEGRYESSEKEQADLMALQRGVFANEDLYGDVQVNEKNIFLAFPCQPGQLLARHLSKYSKIVMKENNFCQKNAPVMLEDVTIEDQEKLIWQDVKAVIELLKKGHVVVPTGSTCEISHHYGVENFRQTGVTMIDCINREYCKKILVVLPGQNHPVHYHVKKEETFLVLYGELQIECDGVQEVIHRGETKTIERKCKHSFSSKEGCVFEEISTTHYKNDSFYDEEEPLVSPRKTRVYLTEKLIEQADLGE